MPLLLAFAPLWWVAMLLGGPDEGSVMHLLEAELTGAVRTRLVAVMLIPVLVSLAVLWQVQEGFLEAALHAIDTDHGGIDAYLRKRIGLGPAAVGALSARYLQGG